MKKKLTSSLLLIAVMIASMSAFVSCKDYDESTDVNGRLSSLNTYVTTQIANLNSQISSLKATAVSLQDQINVLQTVTGSLQEQINDVNGEISTLKSELQKRDKSIADLQTQLNDVINRVTELENNAANYVTKDDLEAQIKAISEAYVALANIYGKLTEIQGIAEAARDKATEAYDLANNVLSVADANTTSIKNLEENTIPELQKAIANLESKILDLDYLKKAFVLREEFDAWGDKLTEAAANATEALALAKTNSTKVKEMEDEIAKLKELIGNINSEVTKKMLEDTATDIKTAFAEADKKLQEQIDSINNDVTSLKETITGTIKSYITNILVQGTYTPVLGYAKMPFDLQTNILATYYRYATVSGEFPSRQNWAYNDNIDIYDADDYALFNGSAYAYEQGELMSSKDAGKLYVTINPVSKDFSSVDLQLVNSQGEVAPGVTLKPLEKSEQVLTFAWTRGTQYPLYEAEVEIDPETANQLWTEADIEALKEVTKDFVNRDGTLGMTNFAATLYKLFSKKQEAYGLTTSWTDPTTGSEMSVYSDFGIAAFGIRPLGWNSFDILDTYATKFVNRLDQGMSNIINFGYAISDAHFTADGAKILEIIVDEIGEDGEVLVNGKVLTADMIQKIIDEISDELNLQGAAKGRNRMEELLSMTIPSYVNMQYTKRIRNYLANPSIFLQPTIVCENAKGGSLLFSESIAIPTNIKIGSSTDIEGAPGIVITPTTFSAELLAPAYKKYVAVTNVYKSDSELNVTAKGGDATCQAARDLANSQENWNTPFDGGQKGLWLQSSEEYKGYIYEITYQALDYFGKIACKKFYVRFV